MSRNMMLHDLYGSKARLLFAFWNLVHLRCNLFWLGVSCYYQLLLLHQLFKFISPYVNPYYRTLILQLEWRICALMILLLLMLKWRWSMLGALWEFHIMQAWILNLKFILFLWGGHLLIGMRVPLLNRLSYSLILWYCVLRSRVDGDLLFTGFFMELSLILHINRRGL
jgi:hypothetical protein